MNILITYERGCIIVTNTFLMNDVFAEQRKAESSKIKQKYPERIPVSAIYAPDIMKNEHN